jgi:V/A-type H+-transporting ATPase subunit K
MDAAMMEGLARAGAAATLSLAAIGSAFGTCAAGMAAIGGWKKCYVQKKAAPFILVVFVGAPLSQTIYGMILMNSIKNAESFVNWPAMLVAGILGGIALGASAWLQGRAGAAGADALAETNQGFGNYLMTIGVVETVALFVMVFVQGALN